MEIGDIVVHSFADNKIICVIDKIDNEWITAKSLDTNEVYKAHRVYFQEADNVYGQVSTSPTGSKRYNEGKPEFSHLNPEFIKGMAELMTKSAEKYGTLNWAKGQELTTPLDSLFRHYVDYCAGENDDKESKMNHMFHIAVNAMIVWYSELNYPELDNRFDKTLEKVRE